MNTERIISRTKYRLAGLLAAVALLAAGCTADEDTDAPYLYFGEEIESLSYTVNGGSLTVEMYSNMGPWVIEPAYTGDEEWIDIWPDEGDDSGRFTVTVAANDGAYTRYSTVNVVIGGRVVKSFEVMQSGVDPSIALDMGSDHIMTASKGGTITVPLKTNVGWKPVALESAAGWISFGESADAAQELIVAPNTGGERTGVVRFQAIGTNMEKLYADLTIVQFDTAQDPNNGEKLTVAEAVARYADAGKITDNVWVEGYVTSDREKRNFDLNVMTLQDDSRRGLLFEFASTNDNTFRMNERLKVHLLGQQLVTDATTHSLKVAAFTSNSVFERDEAGTGIAPVELESIAELPNYENTLVTLKKVEFVQPAGTYCNIDERYTQPTPSYATIAYNATAMPFCDGNDFYGHLLRDEEGNTCKLYTTTWFLDRFAALVPEGSGPLTGIVTKYYKQSTGEVYIIRLRRHEDNRVSSDASTRMSKTLIQFGPFDDTNTYDKLTPRVGGRAGRRRRHLDGLGLELRPHGPGHGDGQERRFAEHLPGAVEQLHELQRPRLRLVPVFLGLHRLDDEPHRRPRGLQGRVLGLPRERLHARRVERPLPHLRPGQLADRPDVFRHRVGRGGERPAVGVHQDRRNHLARLVLVPPVAAVHPQTSRRDEEQAEVHDPLPRHPQLERRQRHGERQFDGEHDRRQGRRPAHQLLADRRDIRTSKKRNEP